MKLIVLCVALLAVIAMADQKDDDEMKPRFPGWPGPITSSKYDFKTYSGNLNFGAGEFRYVFVEKNVQKPANANDHTVRPKAETFPTLLWNQA